MNDLKQTIELIEKFKNLPVQVKAGFAFFLCTVFQRAFTIITTPIFTRLLTTHEYGEYSVFISWMGILSCFVIMSINSGIYTQAIVKFENRRNEYSSSMQGLTISLVFTWFCVYLCFRGFWNDFFSLNTAQMAAMFVIMWTHAIFGFWSAEQRVEYKYKKLIFVTFFASILQPILCVVFIFYFSNKVTGLVWGIAVAGFVSYISLFVEQMKRGKLFFSKSNWNYALKLAIPLIPHYLSVIVLNSSDRIMIKYLTGSMTEAGIYNLSYTISMCGLLINQAMLQTLNPWLYSKIKSVQFQNIRQIAYPVLVCIGVFNLGIILFTPEILAFFAPPSYHDAIWVMPPITMSVFFMFSYNLFSTFEFYYEKTHYVSIATVTGSVLNVILNFIFIKLYGYYAAGYTTLFCYFVFAAMHYCFMSKICKEEINNVKVYDIKILGLITVTFLAMGFMFMCTYEHIMLRYGLISVIMISLLWKKRLIVDFFSMLIDNRKSIKNSI